MPAEARRALTWPAALALTLAAVAGALLLDRASALALFAAALLATLCALTASLRPLGRTLAVALPFAVPLLVLHAVVNPQFAAAHWVWSLVPLRPAGLAFAALVWLRLVALFAAGLLWLHVDRDALVADLVRLRVPPSLLLLATQAVAVAGTVERRARAIYAAQQARGVRLRGGPLGRAAALPKIALPLFVAVLSEADGRAAALATRGFGSGRLAVWEVRRPTARDALGIAAACGLLLLALVLR